MEERTTIIGGSVRILPLVRCRKCGAQEYSEQISESFGPVSIHLLSRAVSDILTTRLIQPPIGWSISGRGNYDCPACMAKA
jgi:hypothetical protein